MNRLRRHRPTPATVIACIALLVALGGTGYAATSLAPNSVGAKQLKKDAVVNSKIKNNAVNGKKVKDNSLTGADILESSLAQVPTAANATHATSADSATNATNATNASTLNSLSSAAFARSSLPAGQLETGNFAAWGTGIGFIGVTINFAIPLSSNVPGTNAQFIASGAAFTAQCPAPGQAAAGYLCVYERAQGNRNPGGGSQPIWRSEGAIDEGASKTGFWIWYTAPGAGGSWSYGEWAVRAPASSSSPAVTPTRAAQLPPNLSGRNSALGFLAR